MPRSENFAIPDSCTNRKSVYTNILEHRLQAKISVLKHIFDLKNLNYWFTAAKLPINK